MLNETKGYKVFTVFNTILLSLISIAMIFPYLNVIALSFNDGRDSMLGGITLWPRVWTTENYVAILTDSGILTGFFNSVLRVIIGTVLALLVQFGAAYAFTKRDLPGRRFMMSFLTIPMFLSGGLIAHYIWFSKIGLLNNFWVYILPTLFSFYNMTIIRSYLDTIPASLIEAANIEGANEILIFIKIVLPLSMPILATIVLWLAVGHWNDWTTTLYYVTRKELYTIQFILMQTIKEGEAIASQITQAQLNGEIVSNTRTVTTESMKAAQIVIVTIPIILVYPFLQKYFIKGIMIGSVKE